MIFPLLVISCTLGFAPFKNKQLKYLVLLLEIVTIIVLFSGNNSTVDQMAYSAAYSSEQYGYFEPGYSFLCRAFHAIGFNYTQFKIIVSLILIFSIHKAFGDFNTMFWNKAIATWLLTSFVFEAEQSRFFIAASIVICGMQFLAKDTIEKKDIVCFFLCIAIAATFHVSTLFYCFLVIIPLMKHRKIEILTYVITCFVVVIMIISILNNNDWSAVGDFLYLITKNERIRMWFDFNTKLGYLECVYYQCALFGLVWITNEILENVKAKTSEKQFCILIKNTLLIMFWAMPLYMISTDFIRLIRGLFLPCYLAIWIGIRRGHIKSKLILLCGIIIFALSFNVLRYGNIFALNNEHFSPMLISNDWL